MVCSVARQGRRLEPRLRPERYLHQPRELRVREEVVDLHYRMADQSAAAPYRARCGDYSGSPRLDRYAGLARSVAAATHDHSRVGDHAEQPVRGECEPRPAAFDRDLDDGG